MQKQIFSKSVLFLVFSGFHARFRNNVIFNDFVIFMKEILKTFAIIYYLMLHQNVNLS